ncbi:MAG: hypothetical protein ACM3YE_17680, partial [Bacteroidota bacterium]
VEIERRRELNYPPFAEFVKIGFTGLNSEKVREAATAFAQICRGLIEKNTGLEREKNFIELMGPAPALIPKIESKYRWQLLLKSNSPNLLCDLVNGSWSEFPFRKFADLKIIKDRNPYSIV